MRRSFLTVATILLAIFWIAGVRVHAESDPPAVEKEWSLIASMCDLTVEELRETLTDETAKVFKWNGDDYEEVDSLLRGYGYVLSSGTIHGLASLCKKPNTEFNDTVVMQPGWNLLGNPYAKTLTIREIMGSAEESFSDAIFEYDGKNYKQVDKGDKIKWGVSVWVYTEKGAALTFPFECQSLKITNDRHIQSIPIIGESMPFSAYCSDEVDIEITDLVTWNTDPSGILNATDIAGSFLAVAAGTTSVSASYRDNTSDSISVTIEDPTATLEEIVVSASPTTIDVGESSRIKVVAVYSNGIEKDVSLIAKLTSSDTTVATLKSNSLTGVSGGTVEVSASYTAPLYEGSETTVELTGSVTITVEEIVTPPEYIQLYITAFPQTMEIHEVANVNAYGVTEGGVHELINDKVTWSFDNTMGQLETSTGHFYPTAIGTVSFTVSLDDLSSSPASIEIIDKQLIWIGIFPKSGDLRALPCPSYFGFMYCYDNNYIELGKSGSYYAMADFNDGSYSYDITSTIEIWESATPDILSIDSSGNITANKTGLAAVRAYRDGVYSEWSWVQVVDSSTDEFLILEYSNRETIVEVGDETPLNVTYYKRSAYSVPPYQVYSSYVTDGKFTATRVTGSAQWSVEDTAIGSFSAYTSMFSGLSAGRTNVSAAYNGLQSNSVLMEVWKPEDINFCDPDNPVEAQWTDNKTLVRLAANCDTYDSGDEVRVVFDALESDYTGRRVLDVCLDLYIYNENQELVKTIRNENCSPTPLFRAAAGFTPVFNYGYEWDQKDDSGNQVPPGDYIAVARFYVLYCPVLKVNFTIQ